ncbi:unnamed protein product [Prunus brigantina]
MEAKQVRCAVLVCLVLGLVMGQSTPQLFQLCYGACFGICIVKEHNPLKCGIRCVKKCILTPEPSDGHQTNSLQFCKFGCATSLCTNISTKDNPNEQKVKNCVDSCSGTCTNAQASTKN